MNEKYDAPNFDKLKKKRQEYYDDYESHFGKRQKLMENYYPRKTKYNDSNDDDNDSDGSDDFERKEKRR